MIMDYQKQIKILYERRKALKKPYFDNIQKANNENPF